MKKNNSLNMEDLLRLSNIHQSTSFGKKESLKDLFEKRINELGISKTNACEIINIQSRTLTGILEGTQKSVDFTNLVRLSSFLQISRERMLNLFVESLDENFPEEITSTITPEEIKFIKENFDLAVLKKAGFISNITDFKQITERIRYYFGLKKIFDYKRPILDIAFSEGKIKPKNELSRSFWIKSANDIFEEISNPHEYDREGLIKFFPEIRWHTTSLELGLKNVMKSLFVRGITVIYLPSLPSLHLRGATFAVNNKPCIVLTDYKGFYPTIWFALIHELFHVLFDWEEIRSNQYHLSDEDVDQLSVKEKEDEANNFAREYLLSKEKTSRVRPLIYDQRYIEEFAKNNHVHPSFIYVFNAYDVGAKDRMAWARARRLSPSVEDSIYFINNSWDSPQPIVDFAKLIRTKVFN